MNNLIVIVNVAALTMYVVWICPTLLIMWRCRNRELHMILCHVTSCFVVCVCVYIYVCVYSRHVTSRHVVCVYIYIYRLKNFGRAKDSCFEKSGSYILYTLEEMLLWLKVVHCQLSMKNWRKECMGYGPGICPKVSRGGLDSVLKSPCDGDVLPPGTLAILFLYCLSYSIVLRLHLRCGALRHVSSRYVI